MLSPPAEILMFAVVILVFVAFGAYVGRGKDVQDEAMKEMNRHRIERTRTRAASRGRSTATDAYEAASDEEEDRLVLVYWIEHPAWGKTLKGGFLGALAGIALYAVAVISR